MLSLNDKDCRWQPPVDLRLKIQKTFIKATARFLVRAQGEESQDCRNVFDGHYQKLGTKGSQMANIKFLVANIVFFWAQIRKNLFVENKNQYLEKRQLSKAKCADQ